MKRSLFQPIVTVGDDCKIDVDWSDSYVNTFDDETQEITYAEPDGQAHSALLDAVLDAAVCTPAQSLRRLADYLALVIQFDDDEHYCEATGTSSELHREDT